MDGERGAIAVAFDMDGLMFETESVYWRSAEVLLGRRGFKYTRELCDAVMGRPPEYAFKSFIAAYSLPDDWRALQRESEEIFVELLADGYETQPRLVELLDILDAREIARCVCTSSARRIADEVLKKDGIGERFDFIVTSDDVARGKPDPEIYLSASRRLGARPQDTLVLEDSVAGSEAARAAGSPCCMLRARHNANADFSRAKVVVDRLDAPELVALLAPRGNGSRARVR